MPNRTLCHIKLRQTGATAGRHSHAATMAVYVPIPSGKSLKVRRNGRPLFRTTYVADEGNRR